MATRTKEPRTVGTRIQRVNKFGDTSRFYDVDGLHLPSVTTILSAISKPALVNWAAKVERQAAIKAACDVYEGLTRETMNMSRVVYEATLTDRIGKVKAFTKETAKAAEIGTQAHELIEYRMREELGLPIALKAPEVVPAAALAYASYEEWRRQADLMPTHCEFTVHSKEHAYAGTADWLGTLLGPDGTLTAALGDWKTGKALYGEALLQNAAYVHAAREMGHLVECGVIIRLPKVDGDGFEVRWVTPAMQEELFGVFLHVVELWRWQQKGARLDPGAS